jgi:hypothetical protein
LDLRKASLSGTNRKVEESIEEAESAEAARGWVVRMSGPLPVPAWRIRRQWVRRRSWWGRSVAPEFRCRVSSAAIGGGGRGDCRTGLRSCLRPGFSHSAASSCGWGATSWRGNASTGSPGEKGGITGGNLATGRGDTGKRLMLCYFSNTLAHWLPVGPSRPESAGGSLAAGRGRPG